MSGSFGGFTTRMRNPEDVCVHYLHIFNNDSEVLLITVSGQQVLTRAAEGEEFVVKGLEVGLTHHQAFTYTPDEIAVAKPIIRHKGDPQNQRCIIQTDILSDLVPTFINKWRAKYSLGAMPSI